MEKLPTELIIDKMIDMPDDDLKEFRMSNKRIYSIYKANEKLIYLEKIKNEFECVQTPKDLYLILKETPKDILQKSCKKYFKRNIPCNDKDLREYMSKTFKDIPRLTLPYQINLLIEMYDNIYNCFNSKTNTTLNTLHFLNTLKQKIDDHNDQIITLKNIPNETKAKWKKYYNTRLIKLKKMVQDRIDNKKDANF